MIVVDTNIIGYLFLSSDKSTLSEEALLKDSIWAAPRLWRSELRNVLALYLRKELLYLTDAQQIMAEATYLMQGREYEVTSNQVLELANASSCSAYDCEFVALARDLEVSLVTVDRQILADFPDTALSLEVFVGGRVTERGSRERLSHDGVKIHEKHKPSSCHLHICLLS